MYNKVSFTLPQLLTIQKTEETLQSLRALPISANTMLEVDIEPLQSLGTAGLQLLLSADKTVQASGGVMKVKNISDALFDACLTAGLDDDLQKWI